MGTSSAKLFSPDVKHTAELDDLSPTCTGNITNPWETALRSREEWLNVHSQPATEARTSRHSDDVSEQMTSEVQDKLWTDVRSSKVPISRLADDVSEQDASEIQLDDLLSSMLSSFHLSDKVKDGKTSSAQEEPVTDVGASGMSSSHFSDGFNVQTRSAAQDKQLEYVMSSMLSRVHISDDAKDRMTSEVQEKQWSGAAFSKLSSSHPVGDAMQRITSTMKDVDSGVSSSFNNSGDVSEQTASARQAVVKSLQELCEIACQRRSRGILATVRNAPEDMVQYIMLSCADADLDSVMKGLVGRGLWRLAEDLVVRCVRAQLGERVSETSDPRLQDMEFAHYALPHCPRDQMDSVLEHCVARGMWYSAWRVMQCGSFSEKTHAWAATEASKIVSDHDCILFLLPNCYRNHLGSVLSNLMERGMWVPVGVALRTRDCSYELRELVVNEASRRARDFEFAQYFLHHCPEQTLDSVLKQLVVRGCWTSVGEMLRRKVTETQLRYALSEASERADDESFQQRIMSHCTPSSIIVFAITVLLVNARFHIVRHLLFDIVTNTLCTWALAEPECPVQDEFGLLAIVSNCRVDVAHAVELSKALKQEREKCVAGLANPKQVGWKESLCELLFTTVVDKVRVELSSKVIEEFKYSDPTEEHKEQRVYVQDLCLGEKRSQRRVSAGDSGHAEEPTEQRISAMNSIDTKDNTEQKASADDSDYTEEHTEQSSSAEDTSHDGERTEQKASLRDSELADEHEEQNVSAKDSGLTEEHTEQRPSAENSNPTEEDIEQNVSAVYEKIIACVRDSGTNYKNKGVAYVIDKVKDDFKVTSDKTHANTHLPVPLFHFLKRLSLYNGNRNSFDSDDLLLIILAVLPVCSELQNAALRIMLRQTRWDVITHAHLSHVWEQERRLLFQAAVSQRRWGIVKQWADYSLHDDLRWWALEEAVKEKQWEVCLLLADHGLTEVELMGVHRRLAKYANLKVFLHMFERGAYVTEIKEFLKEHILAGKQSDNAKFDLIGRCVQLLNLEEKLKEIKLPPFPKKLTKLFRRAILFWIFYNPHADLSLALKAAVKYKAWNIVIQLIRGGLDPGTKNSLFMKMMRQQQWDMLRVLLEEGVSTKLCVSHLPQLMDMNQWTLVARVMEYVVGDSVLQEILHRALEKREGSVVWQCMSIMQTPLPEEYRERLFQLGFSSELWQVVKPLVEWKDQTGIRHRDTVILEAIEQRQWDVVDHCQRHHGNLDIMDDNGETPLNRAASQKDWEAVEALVSRGSDPNLPDSRGYSVLNGAIKAQQWNTVKLLIQFHANIHQNARVPAPWYKPLTTCTPLNLLIDERQAEMIDHTFLWCPDQWKGLNKKGETALHIAALSGWWNIMYYLIARRVDPLALTTRGESVLMYAVRNKDCPQRMVAECIRLGFSTHQPSLSSPVQNLACFATLNRTFLTCFQTEITSPFCQSVLLGLPIVGTMLYESGSCSYRELFGLYSKLKELTVTPSAHGEASTSNFLLKILNTSGVTSTVLNFLPNVKEMATTPRSLVSTCRLVISHCLDIRGKRRYVHELPLSRKMKSYVLFEDLTDARYGQDVD